LASSPAASGAEAGRGCMGVSIVQATVTRSAAATAAATSAATSSLSSTRSASLARGGGGGCGGPKNERATSKRRSDGSGGPQAPGQRGGLALVEGARRPKPPRGGGGLDGGHVLDGRAGHLPQVLAGDQRRRPQLAGNGVGDPHHHPPVQHDRQLRRSRVAQ